MSRHNFKQIKKKRSPSDGLHRTKVGSGENGLGWGQKQEQISGGGFVPETPPLATPLSLLPSPPPLQNRKGKKEEEKNQSKQTSVRFEGKTKNSTTGWNVRFDTITFWF